MKKKIFTLLLIAAFFYTNTVNAVGAGDPVPPIQITLPPPQPKQPPPDYAPTPTPVVLPKPDTNSPVYINPTKPISLPISFTPYKTKPSINLDSLNRGIQPPDYTRTTLILLFCCCLASILAVLIAAILIIKIRKSKSKVPSTGPAKSHRKVADSPQK